MNPIIHGELGWLLAAKLEARRDRLLVACAGIAPISTGCPSSSAATPTAGTTTCSPTGTRRRSR